MVHVAECQTGTHIAYDAVPVIGFAASLVNRIEAEIKKKVDAQPACIACFEGKSRREAKGRLNGFISFPYAVAEAYGPAGIGRSAARRMYAGPVVAAKGNVDGRAAGYGKAYFAVCYLVPEPKRNRNEISPLPDGLVAGFAVVEPEVIGFGPCSLLRVMDPALDAHLAHLKPEYHPARQAGYRFSGTPCIGIVVC